MEDISRHTGANIGGMNPVQIIPVEDIRLFTADEDTLEVSITLHSGKSWYYLHGADGSISLDSDIKDEEAGLLYQERIKFMIGKDRKDASPTLHMAAGRPLVARALDKNGIMKVYGTTENGARLTFKPVKTAEVAGNNGYEVTIIALNSMPSLFWTSQNASAPPEDPAIPD